MGSHNGQFPQKSEKELGEFDAQIAKFNADLEKKEVEMESGKTDKFCGIAFVGFEMEAQKDFVLDNPANEIDNSVRRKQAFGATNIPETKDKKLKMLGNQLVVEMAPVLPFYLLI